MTVTLSQIADELNLEKAWVRAKWWAQTSDVFYDEEEYDRFGNHLTANLRVAKWLVLSGYEPARALGIVVPKEGGSRVLYRLGVWDSVVAMAMLNMLIPTVEQLISNKSSGQSFGNRFHAANTKQVVVDWRDQHALFAAAARGFGSLPEGYWYVRSDIADYYPSIPVERLLALLVPFLDEDTYGLLGRLLTAGGRVGNDEHVAIDGLPIGPAYSALLANLYLADFDEWMLSRTDHYVRYVDDFFFAAPSREYAVGLFHAAGQWLSEIGLALHPDKSEWYPVTDTACIDETIRRLKYDLRVETSELQASGLQDDAELLLYEAFVDSQFYEHPRTAAFVAWRLAEIGYGDVESLTAMVCRVLQAGGLTVPQIRRLVAFVVENCGGELPPSLIEYLVSFDDAVVRLVVLDLLTDYQQLAERLPVHVFTALTESDSFLVRAYAYQTLGNRGEHRMTIDDLRARYAQEHSPLVRAKIIPLLLAEHAKEVASELPLRMTESAEVREAILGSIRYLDVSGARAAMAAAPHDEMLHTEFSQYVYALLMHSLLQLLAAYLDTLEPPPENQDRDEALASVAIGLFEERLSAADHLGCLQVLSTVAGLDPDLAAQSVRRLGGVLEPPSGDVAIRFVRGIAEVVPDIASKTAVWALEGDASPRLLFLGRYRVSMDLIPLEPGGVGLYEVECLDTGETGVLELIPWPRLEAHGLSSAEFHAVLDQLSAQGVTTSIQKGDIEITSGVDYTWVVYLYPEQSESLGDYMERTRQTARMREKIAVILDVAKRVQESGLADRMQSVHGESVVTDDCLHTRLCAIGTSIVDTRYMFAFSREYRSDALGSANLSFCLGMLLYEYVTGQSGYEDLQLTKREQGSLGEKVAEALPANKGVPHVAYVIKRATAPLLDHRYSQIGSLIEDVAHVVAYLDKLEQVGLTKPTDVSWSLVVADFVDFRVKVMLRSPGAAAFVTAQERRRHLFDELTQEWIGILAEAPTQVKSHDLGVPYRVRMSSPAAEQLVKLAECLWYFFTLAQSRFGATYPPRAPLLVFARLLDFESAATAYSLVADLANKPLDFEGLSSEFRSWATHGDGGIWIGSSDDASKRVMVDVDARRARRLATIVASLGSPRQAALQLGDTIDVALVAALRTRGLDFGSGTNLHSFDDLWLAPPVQMKTVRTLLLEAAALEAELECVLSTGDHQGLESILAQHLIPVIELLRRLRRGQRVRGRVTSYDRLGHQQGEFEWRPQLVRRESCVWRSREVLRIGAEPWRTDLPLQASLDILPKGVTVLSVMTPISRSPVLALDRVLRRTRRRCRENWILCLVVVIIVVLSALLIANQMMGQAVLLLVADILLLLLGLSMGELRDALLRRSPGQ